MFKNYDHYTLALVLKAYLVEGKSHRTIQKEILNLPAPPRGGGFVVMEILHFFKIKGEHKSIFEDKNINPNLFNLEVSNLLKELLITEEKAEEELENNLNPNGKTTENERMLKTRVYQNKLRDKIIKNYNSQCAICDINKLDLLVCSHIVPWSYDEKNRLNLENSICLCVMHDKLFDKGYFHLNDNYEIILSNRIDENLNAFFIDKKFKEPKKFAPRKDFLKLHREEIFE
jgi:putative restriction endonuclease